MMSNRKRPAAVAGLVLILLVFSAARVFRDRSSKRSHPASAPTLENKTVAVSQKLTVTVKKVQDGDSFVARLDNGSVTIRLFAIDCPEYKQSYGREARAFAASIIEHKAVQVEVVDRDRYGRIVGLVTVDGRLLNEVLVREGWAWAYRRYSDRFVPAEKEAKAKRKGLWRGTNPEPPWLYRKNNPSSR